MPPRLLIFTLLSLNACSASPLFNHVTAQPAAPPAQTTATESPTESKPVETEKCEWELPQNSLCLSLTWNKEPGEEEGAFTLRFWRKGEGQANKGPYFDPPHTVAVQLWMPSMGHGSAPVTIERSEPGVYAVTRVFFVMPGDWDIRIQLKKEREVLEQVALPIKI